MTGQYTDPFARRLVDIDDGAIEVWEGGDGPVTFVTTHPYLIANDTYPGAGLSDGLASVGRTVFVTPRGSDSSFAETRREKFGMDTLVDDLEQLRQALAIDYALRPESLYSPASAINQRLAEIKERAGMGEEYHRAFASASVHNHDVVDTVLATTPRDDLRGIAGSELAVMNHSGHFPFEEEPAEFRRVVADFVQRRVVAQ